MHILSTEMNCSDHWHVFAGVCDAGNEDINGECTPCTAGYYKEEESNAPCDQCEIGKSTPSTGSVTPDDCLCKLVTGVIYSLHVCLTPCKLCAMSAPKYK